MKAAAPMKPKSFFIQTPMMELTKSMQLVTLRPDATVLQVLETFRNNNILSAPFVDESGNCFGSIDMLDIIAYACQKLNLTKSQDIIKDQLQLMQEFLKRPVMGLKDLSNRNPWISPFSKELEESYSPFEQSQVPSSLHPRRESSIGSDDSIEGCRTHSRT